MAEGIITIVALLLTLLVWWLKNRKTKTVKDEINEAIAGSDADAVNDLLDRGLSNDKGGSDK